MRNFSENGPGPRTTAEDALEVLFSPTASGREFLGLVDEVVPADHVVDRAIKWCRDLLALPQAAMGLTRRQARADLVAEFARDIDQELAQVGSWWWNQETQAALHRMVEQLAMKKKA